MVFEILESKPTNIAEVKDELDKVKERDKELNFRAQKTYEYLEQFCKLDKKKADALLKKLLDLKVSRLRELHYNKIIDIMPTHSNDVKVALQGYNISVTNENCKKIADIVKQYAE